ncbi:hypothetical protein [Streptomyces sp. NPDC048172]|uniref:hypothetical protein n=1 Tax=Streptomyces sp. NPDC048172 TaxID=3365505 RepID=UPI0037198118
MPTCTWELTLPREAASIGLAGRAAGVAVLVLGVGPCGAGALRDSVRTAAHYLVTHSRARRFRLLLCTGEDRCDIEITDRPGDAPRPAQAAVVSLRLNVSLPSRPAPSGRR